MLLLHIIILALVQGITEFLPVSSSGHLVLTHSLLGENVGDLCWEKNRTLDVAVHVGTLLSVLVYFRGELFKMSRTCLVKDSQERRLLTYIAIASVPVIVAGLVLQIWKPDWLCLLEITAWTTLIFGILLGVADKYKPCEKTLGQMTMKDSILIGLSQALALIPGTSRSGVTMTAARFLGFTRVEAAHFSLLLAIVAIGGAGFLGTLDLIQNGQIDLGIEALIAVILSFLSGWAAIAVMMKWLEKSTFMPFVIYRVILGIALLGLIYSGILG